MTESHRVVQRTNQRIFFERSEEFDFQLIYALALTSVGVSEIGECLQAVQDVGEEDYDGWRCGWERMATVVQGQAELDEEVGHLVSARAGYLRAWNYFTLAEFWLTYGSPDRAAAHARSHALFQRAAALPGPEFRALSIPFDGRRLPGWFFPAHTGRKARTLILVTGTDGLSEQGFATAGGRRARERGWNLLAFDGPGQLGALYADSALVWRPD